MPALLNTVPDFLAYWRATANAPYQVKLIRWKELYASKHKPLLSYYLTEFSPNLSEAFQKYNGIVNLIGPFAESLGPIISEIEDKLREKFKTDLQIRAIIFVGGFESSAFVAYVNNEPWLWLACERLCIYARDFAYVKIAHECSHILHAELLRKRYPSLKLEKYERRLYYHILSEGLAIYISKTLFPNLDDSVYMLFEEDTSALKWCIQNEATLLEMIGGMQEAEDRAARSMWFGSLHHKSIPYAGTGFYVASILTEELLKNRGMDAIELAQMHPRDYLNSITEAIEMRKSRTQAK